MHMCLSRPIGVQPDRVENPTALRMVSSRLMTAVSGLEKAIYGPSDGDYTSVVRLFGGLYEVC